MYQQYDEAAVFQDVYRWIKVNLDINYPNTLISNYSYLAESENVEEIYRMISAFGTGITGFKMVDVAPEKVLGNIPKAIRESILSEIEKKR